MKSLVLILIFFISNSLIYSQSNQIYIPVNVKKSYENNIRNYDGTPGKNYWQNRSNYKIKVDVEPVSRIISGSETIEYFNESPDTLNQIVIRLLQNINKKSSVRDFEMPEESLNDGMILTKLLINGKEVDLNNRELANFSNTNLSIKLENRILPNSKTEIQAEWNFTMPKEGGIRMGTYGDSTFFVAYWYPQISVYDDVDGWDKIPYSGQVEFYNDFNNYDVEITAPAKMTVWATGELQNAEEIFNEDILAKFKKAHTSNEIVKIIDKENLRKSNFKGKEKNIWKFIAEKVPDFTFAASSKYLWDATSLEVDKNSKRRVLISAAYNPESKDFYEVAELSQKTIEMLSFDFPAVPYPFPTMTVFNGSGGMEFVMMVNDGSFESRASTVHVTSHEIAHTYFPFYMGINEKKYAWMDEGWAVMIPYKMQNMMEPSYDPISRNSAGYAKSAGYEHELPLMTPSNLMRGPSYRLAAYGRSAEAYRFLRDALGEKVFDNALREYIDRWNEKHPLPYDFFFTFNDVVKEDLSWFWKPWFFESGFGDLAIKNVSAENGTAKIIVEKIGNLPLPVELNIEFTDGSTSKEYKNASVWKNGNKEFSVEIKSDKIIKSVKLGSGIIPDVNDKNNIYEAKSS